MGSIELFCVKSNIYIYIACDPSLYLFPTQSELLNIVMIRRDPTRIELTLDDIQEYHLRVKQDNETKRNSSKVGNSTNLLDGSTSGDSGATGSNIPITKTRAENIHERIGFNPAPRNT